MKIALIGTGKMGRMVEKVAPQHGHNIVSTISARNPQWVLHDAQVCIDFSHPECVLRNIKAIASRGKSIVVGTTGWDHSHVEAEKIVRDAGVGLLYSPNFSLGVHLFLAMLSSAATLMNAFEEYDVGIIEEHHKQKVDSPSGTALAAARIILEKIKRKKTLLTDNPEGKIDHEQLHVSSIRCGSIPGTHSVVFDSPADTITLTHKARNREGFAFGALVAAEWLQGRKGFFTIQDMLKELI